MVDTFGTNTVPEARIIEAVRRASTSRRAASSRRSTCASRSTAPTAAYGHFGRTPEKSAARQARDDALHVGAHRQGRGAEALGARRATARSSRPRNAGVRRGRKVDDRSHRLPPRARQLARNSYVVVLQEQRRHAAAAHLDRAARGGVDRHAHAQREARAPAHARPRAQPHRRHSAAQLRRVQITRVEKSTYYAELHVQRGTRARADRRASVRQHRHRAPARRADLRRRVAARGSGARKPRTATRRVSADEPDLGLPGRGGDRRSRAVGRAAQGVSGDVCGLRISASSIRKRAPWRARLAACSALRRSCRGAAVAGAHARRRRADAPPVAAMRRRGASCVGRPARIASRYPRRHGHGAPRRSRQRRRARQRAHRRRGPLHDSTIAASAPTRRCTSPRPSTTASRTSPSPLRGVRASGTTRRSPCSTRRRRRCRSRCRAITSSSARPGRMARRDIVEVYELSNDTTVTAVGPRFARAGVERRRSRAPPADFSAGAGRRAPR